MLDTKIPDRKIDLSLDYEVNNELAFALYARAMQEHSSSPERLEYLKKAVAAYRRTLSIDSENVTAHHALGLAYGAAPWGENRAAVSWPKAPIPTPNNNPSPLTPTRL